MDRQKILKLTYVEIGKYFAGYKFEGGGFALAGDFLHMIVAGLAGQHVNLFEPIAAAFQPINGLDAPGTPDLDI